MTLVVAAIVWGACGAAAQQRVLVLDGGTLIDWVNPIPRRPAASPASAR